MNCGNLLLMTIEIYDNKFNLKTRKASHRAFIIRQNLAFRLFFDIHNADYL